MADNVYNIPCSPEEEIALTEINAVPTTSSAVKRSL